MNYKILLTLIGIIINVIATLPYIRNVIAGKTKPHIFTWLIWLILATAGFIIQLIGGGGFGALVLGTTSLLNLIILILSIKHSRDNITDFDKTILGLAAVVFAIWLLTENTELAAILVSALFVMGFVPTYRKSWSSPGHELVFTFALSALKQLIGIAALSAYNLLTVLLPVVLFAANVGLVILLMVRRRALNP